MTPSLLLTGATGFLGAQAARQILRHADCTLTALVRARDADEARHRLLRAWWDWPELRAEIGARVQALPGDVTTPNLGLEPAAYARLAAQVTHILHTAGDVRLFQPVEDLRRVNVTGTRHVLDLACAIHAGHGLERFAHVSTAYVAGQRNGPVSEDELTDRFGFSSPYERSKYEAEKLVRQAAHLPVTIFRPGIITGDSLTGAVKAFNTIYYPLRLYLTERLRSAPAAPGLRVDMAPVDYVAGAIARLLFDPRAAGLAFHLTPPPEALPTLGELVAAVRAWAREEMGLALPEPRYLPGLEPLLGHPWTAGLLKRLGGPELAPLVDLLPYFSKQPVFLRANTDRLLGPYPHRWQALLPPLLEYATRHSFWQRSDRTVHEQILKRLQSRRKPITYHDLTPDGSGGVRAQARPAAEMRAEILAAAGGLRALGVQPGDRVAVLGPNSSRYLSALVAIGLVGAVAVPLYPTLPPAEIEALLRAAQARLFLAGSPDLLRRLDQMCFELPVVALGDAYELPPDQAGRVLSWQQFLALASPQSAGDRFAPVSFADPAALFFTSGTTGRAKGVLFRHEQLRWLAETLASMYPWHERHRWGSYMSYLPMSHIVEGLLATYSPYYVPAALDIYFLEDFQLLPQALKISRPTIFFSIPRFFEKVRAAFLQNRLAQAYLKMPDSALRSLLHRLLRRGLLRKTGLTGCRQLLVGSAVATPDLLDFFQQMDIQVHNAYGLTEAPLVSLNRLGRNRIDTVGELLPETRVRFGADGEIEVAGPQVASGYVEDGQVQPFGWGWFATGDLGSLSADGYLSLGGRKHDLLVTAYGENVYPQPVEARLRAIPGVAEALLVGESRPYFAALFWVEAATWSLAMRQALERGVAEVNAGLPKPAQIKRWAVMAGSLTVENGGLTGSMKVKRSYVTARMAAVVDALYAGQESPDILYLQ